MTDYLLNYRRTRRPGYVCGTTPIDYIGIGVVKTITIDHTKCGTANSTNFPMLFAGTYDGTGGEPDLRSVGNGGAVTDANGYDICFYSDVGCTSMLDFERVSWSATTGACEFYVEIPTLDSSNDTVIYLKYGDESITTDQSDSTGTWDSTVFAAVWHFEGNSNDSTDGSHNGTDTGVSYGTAYGKFGSQGALFSGTSKISIGTSSEFDANNRQLEAWAYPTSLAQTWNAVIAHESESPTPYQAILITSNAGVNAAVFFYNAGDIFYYNSGSIQMTINNWWHYSAKYDATVGLEGLINGTVDKTVAGTGNLATINNEILIGNSLVADRGFNGYIDEARYYKVCPSDSFNIANHNSLNSPSSFYTIS